MCLTTASASHSCVAHCIAWQSTMTLLHYLVQSVCAELPAGPFSCQRCGFDRTVEVLERVGVLLLQ